MQIFSGIYTLIILKVNSAFAISDKVNIAANFAGIFALVKLGGNGVR